MLARFRNLNPHTKIELILVMACTSFGFFALGSLSPILPLHLADQGIEPQTIGLMFSTMGVAFAIGEIFWGWLIDRFDPRIALLCGTFLFSLAIGSFLLWKEPVYFFISFFIFGLLIGPAFVMGRWYIGVKAPIAEKAVSMALLMGIISAAYSIAGFSSGFIGARFGYYIVILIAAILPMTLGLILVTQLRKIRFKFPSHQQDQGIGQGGGGAIRWRLPVVISIGVISGMATTTFGINSAFLALYTTIKTGVDASWVGILFGLTGLIRLLVVIPIGRFADRRGKRHFVSVGLAGMIAAYLGVAVSSTYTALLVSALSFSLFSAMMSVLMAMLSERVPQAKQGLAMGILGFSEDSGLIVGSGLGGLFWNARGPSGPFLFGSGMLGACLLGWFILIRSGLLGGEIRTQSRPGYP